MFLRNILFYSAFQANLHTTKTSTRIELGIKGIFKREAIVGPNRRHVKSVLDYGVVESDLVETITSFVVDSDKNYRVTSDHCVIEATLRLVGSVQRLRWSV